MGVKLPRKKPKTVLLSVIYRLQKLLPVGHRTKLKLFLNLEWIFNRVAHESSFKVYSIENHPVRQFSKEFILGKIERTDNVLDLGCNRGEISFFIAEKANAVVGVDYNKKAIDSATHNYKLPNLKFYHGEALDFLEKENAETFNVLILSHILEHLDEPKTFLLKFKDYFEKIYIELPDFDQSYLNHYRKELNLKLIYSDDDHISEFDRNEIKNLLFECDLKILEAEYKYGVQKIWCQVRK